MSTWFGGREEIAIWLAASPLSGDWRWKPLPAHANGQPALAYYSWDEDEGCYLPFALNVLTFRGELISEVDCFITRTIEDPGREAMARMPEQALEAKSLAAAFGNLGLPARLD
jgi:hypothetical protein